MLTKEEESLVKATLYTVAEMLEQIAPSEKGGKLAIGSLAMTLGLDPASDPEGLHEAVQKLSTALAQTSGCSCPSCQSLAGGSTGLPH